MLAEKIVKMALKAGADEAEAFLETNREFEVSVRNGEVETIKQSSAKGVGLTVFKEKKLGFSYTSDFSEESIDEFAKKTVQLSLVADPKPWNGLPDVRKGKMKDLDLYDASVADIPNEKKIQIATEVEKIALAHDKKITKSYGGRFLDAEREVFMVNSKGVSHSGKGTTVGFGATVIASEGSEMQAGGWSSVKRHFGDLSSIESVAKEAGKRAVEKLGARPVETQKAPVVYDRYASGSFWYGILLAMNGDSVFKKTTFLTEYLGKPIAADLITITDDPTISRHVSSIPFDGEGSVTQKNVLIDKGVLKMFIYDSITARKAGVKVNTIATRGGYRSPASANFLNVVVENGTKNREKIIAGIKNGFYITGLRGLGTDIPTGNYSCGASGFWIKDGELAFPVDGVTLGGNVFEMLKNIEVMADDLDLRGGLNSPSFKISEMTIGGKK
jgi:PmbA protein